MNTTNRPLSPHLQVYRPQLTTVLSITHRATGIVLCIGAVLLAVWLLALAGGPASFADVSGLFGSWFGKLVMFLFTLALFYHLCNGIRHLFWDVGYGFELETVYASGKAVLGAAAALTVLTWVIALASGNGA